MDALKKLIDYWNLRDKLNITDDPYIQNATWATEKSNPRVACDCGGDTCHITHLKIYALDISGEIPSELFVLKELMDLNLGQNVLNGSIPAEIEQLSNMQYLSLGINNFTGPVPPELGNLTKLITLSFSLNNFVGALPTSHGKLISLQELRYIDSSGVSGPIPQEFAKSEISSNSVLFQRIGDLSGEDSSLELLQNQKTLSILDLSLNKLTGQVPESFQDLVSLQYLDVSFNPLPGSLPQNFAKVGLSMNVVGTSIDANNLQHKQVFLEITMSLRFVALRVSFFRYFTHNVFCLRILMPNVCIDLGLNMKVILRQWDLLHYIQAQKIFGQNIELSEPYKTARISPSSLRFYGLGLKNGIYRKTYWDISGLCSWACDHLFCILSMVGKGGFT
ncbi:hypothetical protein DKX38_010658 [Salix brachista]|uniref:Leucine-rich repeat-containing N-terminal plant-type domain-containing protein n=1 Tax=Salix brachista TaxID=2182728 RepID=A0A5N5ME52_9ROSI|nr:hypothetical protein DKX38_010658 [Salix brachista]